MKDKVSMRWQALAAVVVSLMAHSGAHAAWSFSASGGPNDAAKTSVAADGTGISITQITGAYAANGGTLPSGAVGTSIVAAGGSCADTTCGVGSANTYGIGGFGAGATWTVGSASALQYYSGGGLGMSSDSTLVTVPNHAMDNGPATDANGKINGRGNTESVMLSFSSSVVLSSIGVGYKFGDADISLFRYTGASAPTLNGTGTSLASMTAAGWELVGNYADLAQDTTNPYNMVNGCSNVNGTAQCSSSSVGSSWWLISAYNTSYGAGTGLDQGNDYFKIYAVAGAACTSTVGGVCKPGTDESQVPEPTSLALVAVGLLGAAGMRRRRAVTAAA